MKFGVDKLFDTLIEELKELENNGLEININGEIKIYFALAIFVGDNLALHSALGFVKCSSSNYPCRFCKATKINVQTSTVIDPALLHNRHNYSEDLKLNDRSKTGLASECIFNQLISYHVTENMSVDIMHDILNGICIYDMALLIKNLISETNITLEMINERIINFYYGIQENDRP